MYPKLYMYSYLILVVVQQLDEEQIISLLCTY